MTVVRFPRSAGLTRDPNEPAPLVRVIGTVLFYDRYGRVHPGADLLACGHEVRADWGWRRRQHARRRCWECGDARPR